MFAIIETGGKQYKVEKGTKLEIEKLPSEKGNKVRFDFVLMSVDDKTTKIGKPFLEGAYVEATILDQIKAEKVRTFKKIAKKRHERTIGHRQKLTVVEVTEIKA